MKKEKHNEAIPKPVLDSRSTLERNYTNQSGQFCTIWIFIVGRVSEVVTAPIWRNGLEKRATLHNTLKSFSCLKSSLYSRYYAEACNEWRGSSPRRSAGATRNTASKKHCSGVNTVSNLTGVGIEPLTSRADS